MPVKYGNAAGRLLGVPVRATQIRAIQFNRSLSRTNPGLADLACTYTGAGRKLEIDCVVLVTSRQVN